MAITPRTLFNSPAPAVVAAVSLLSFSALGTVAYKMSSSCSANRVHYTPKVTFKQADACQSVRTSLQADSSTWSEFDWFSLSSCYEQANNSRRVVEVTTQGLRYYPRSEALFNLKGYHQVRLGEHSNAVATLSLGLNRVGTPTSGTMANNLAWAGVWVPREMELERARTLYKQALRYDASTCEVIHTGLWVEFAVAKESKGLARYEALRNFGELRDRYESCHSRVSSGEWDTLIELLGASVLFDMIDEGVFSDTQLHAPDEQRNGLLVDVSAKLRERYRGSSIDAICRDAMPLETVHHACVRHLHDTVTMLKTNERRQIRRGMTKAELRSALKRHAR